MDKIEIVNDWSLDVHFILVEHFYSLRHRPRDPRFVLHRAFSPVVILGLQKPDLPDSPNARFDGCPN